MCYIRNKLTDAIHLATINRETEVEYADAKSKSPVAKTIKNKNLIFLLVDKADASAAEDFLTNLLNMDNVIIVGAPTAGCMLSGNTYPFKLPNSSVPVFMGTDLYLAPNHKEIEGRGYIPDVMTQFDTLDSVIELIKHYNLLKIITFFTQLLLHFISDLISSVILSGKSFKDFHDMNYQSNNTYHTNN